MVIIEIIIKPRESIRNIYFFINFVLFGALSVISNYFQISTVYFTMAVSFILIILSAIYCLIKKKKKKLTFLVFTIVIGT